MDLPFGLLDILKPACCIIAGGCLVCGLWYLFGPKKIKPHWSMPVALILMGAVILAFGLAVPCFILD